MHSPQIRSDRGLMGGLGGSGGGDPDAGFSGRKRLTTLKARNCRAAQSHLTSFEHRLDHDRDDG